MNEGSVGLAGIGRSGLWIVELDEHAQQGYAFTVSHPRIYLQLPCMRAAEVRRLRMSLENRVSGTFGDVFGGSISIELTDDRVLFRLREGRVLLELVLEPGELEGLAAAVIEACDDAEPTDDP